MITMFDRRPKRKLAIEEGCLISTLQPTTAVVFCFTITYQLSTALRAISTYFVCPPRVVD